MKCRPMGWIVALLCMLVMAACGTSTSRGGSATVTVTPAQAPIGKVGTSFRVGFLGDLGVGRLAEGYSSNALIWIHDGSNGNLTLFDPTANPPGVAVVIPVGHGPGQVAVGPTSVWVANHDDGTVMRIDQHTDRVVATIALAPGQIGALDISTDAVWALNTAKNLVYRIDQHIDRVVATIATPATPTSVSFGAGSLWVCSRGGGQMGLTRIDPQTNHVLAQIDVGNGQGYQCNAVLATSEGVWSEIYNTHTNRTDVLERIDPATNQVVATIHLQTDLASQLPVNASAQFTVDTWGVWVCVETDTDHFLLRIDAETNKFAGKLDQLCGGVVSSVGLEWLAFGPGGALIPVTPVR
jgi:hypothetical protein